MSGGVAWYPENAVDLDTLKKYADFAMYEVKHSTKGEVREFDMEHYRAGVYAMEQRSDFEKLIRGGGWTTTSSPSSRLTTAMWWPTRP